MGPNDGGKVDFAAKALLQAEVVLVAQSLKCAHFSKLDVQSCLTQSPKVSHEVRQG
jgi:hypothetical protein